MTQSVYNLSQAQLAEHLKAWNQPAYRRGQIWDWLYRKLAPSPSAMTNLPADLRRRLEESFTFSSLEIQHRQTSKDGNTEKLLLELHDGLNIELVLMRYRRRKTACISSQSGCGMGCPFCATGQMGFQRNLSAGEIVEQVLMLARQLEAEDEHLTNIVFMGMGEPFHNYEPCLAAIDRLNDPEGLGLGARRFTISTVGVVPMMDRFAEEKRQVNLAVSLHAATDELRNKLVPINRRYPLEHLIGACHNYVSETGRRVSFEWALIHDVNDNLAQARALVRLVQGLNCHVNLIPLNPTPDYPGRSTPREKVKAFAAHLDGQGVTTTIRARRGMDIQAGCGQLATQVRSSNGRSSPED